MILQVLPGAWVKTAGKFLPGEAGSSFVSNLRMRETLAPGTGLAVLVIWVLAALGAAAVLLKRRDG